MKEQAIDNEALALAHSGTPEQRAKSIAILRERDRKVPYDPIVLLELARLRRTARQTRRRAEGLCQAGRFALVR